MTLSTRVVLIPLWLALFAVGLLCLGGFAYGLIRDHHIGDPEIALDLSRSAPAHAQTFRVWGTKPYALYLSTRTHRPPFGDTLRAALEVSIRAPGGRTEYRRTFTGQQLGQVRVPNGDRTLLARLKLHGNPLRRWTVSARVLQPDPRFARVDARVLLRRVRHDPGMGGLVNYALIFPGVVLLLASTLAGHALAMRGVSDLPFFLSGSVAALVILLLLSRLVA